MKKLRVLEVGPSIVNAGGGMATVIKSIVEDDQLGKKFEVENYSSYVEGNKVHRLVYSIEALVRFFLTKRNFDIYHIHVASNGSTFRKMQYARIIKKWNKKMIIHVHGGAYMDFYDNLSSRNQSKVVRFLNDADVVIALSSSWKAKFDQRFGLKNCVVLENGVPEVANNGDFTEDASERASLLYMGRLTHKKGVFDLLRAIQIAVRVNPALKIFFAGEGDMPLLRDTVKKYAIEDNVEFVGWADESKKRKLFSQVRTLVLPSYKEGLPMVILEAFSYGKAVIATNVGAIPEVVGTNNGFLVNPGDVSELARAILKVAENDSRITEMQRNNYELSRRRFGMKTMHQKLANIYQSLER